MSWIDGVKDELNDCDIDFTNESTVLYGIFKNVTHPEISLSSAGKLIFPEVFYIKMNGCQALFRLLKQPDLFFSLPFPMKRSILDLLYLLMYKNIYNVIRLQFSDTLFTSSTAESTLFCKLFLRLLEISIKQTSEGNQLIISRKIARLLGLASAIGMSPTYMRKFLILLRTPTPLTIYLLHAMNNMFIHDIGGSKASPPSFFTFGGPGAGLFTSLSAFPFSKEYQICCWFRSEDIGPVLTQYPSTAKAFSTSANQIQHLVTWANPAQKGLDVYIDGNILVVAVSNQSRAEPTLIKLTERPLQKGIWYHFSIRHNKPKMSFFGNDELTIYLDEEEIFTDNFRFPNLGNLIDTDFAIGRNFNGQMGPVYFLNDGLHPTALTAMAKLDAGRGYDQYNSHLEIVPADLVRQVLGPDRKPHSIAAKVTMSYHPSRCHNGFAIDIHSGRHAAFGNYSQPWNMINPRELFMTMGGISCLIPLFPKLLVETEIDRHYLPIREIENGSYGSSTAGMILVNPSSMPPSPQPPLSPKRQPVTTGRHLTGNTLLEESVLLMIRSKEEEEVQGIGLIGILLSILSKCLKNHRIYQQQLLEEGGVEMIEYVLQCVPIELLQIEGDKCIVALSQLKSFTSESVNLEMKILKCLICNLRLWSNSSMELLLSLLPVIIAEMKANPDKLSRLLSIYELLECVTFFEPIEEDEDPQLLQGRSRDDSLRDNNSNDNGDEESREGGSSPDRHHSPSLRSRYQPEIESVASSENTSVAKIIQSQSLSAELLHTNHSNSNTNTTATNDRRKYEIEVGIAHEHSRPRKLNLTEDLSDADDDHTEEKEGEGSSSERIRHRGSSTGTTSTTATLTQRGKEALRSQNSDGVKSASSLDYHLPSPSMSLRSLRSSVSGGASSVKRLKSFKLALTEIMVHPDEDDHEEEESEERSSTLGGGSENQRLLAVIKEASANLSDDIEEEADENGNSGNEKLSLAQPEYDPNHDNISSFPPTTSTTNSNTLEVIKIDILPKTNPQRKQLRDHLLTMMLLLLKHNPNEREVMAFLDYMAETKNQTVLNELANILLFLMIELGPKILSLITTICGGAEEFISWVLVYLIHQPLESLRCIGIRIITYFYHRSDTMILQSTHLLTKRNNSISNHQNNQKSNSRRFSAGTTGTTATSATAATTTLLPQKLNSILTAGSSNPTSVSGVVPLQGLQRLQYCGGLALLCEILAFHGKHSNLISYAAILELLLTRLGQPVSPYFIQYTDKSMDQIIMNAVLTNSGMGSTKGRNNSIYQSLKMIQQPLVAAHYLAQVDPMRDEGVDTTMTNSIVLPIFFELLPKLPLALYEQIFSDLLALVKHSEGNRDAFCAAPSWHLCMFGLVLALVDSTHPMIPTRSYHTYEMVSELERYTGIHHSKLPLFQLYHQRSQRKITELKREESTATIRAWHHHTNSNSGVTGSPEQRKRSHQDRESELQRYRSYSFYTQRINEVQLAQNFDVWFDLGMKIYSTLLTHAMEQKAGWKEIDRSVSASFESEIGYSIAQTILSHLLNDLTFTMKSKYKELQRLVRSTNSSENQSAMDKLENYLNMLLTSTDVALINQQCLFPSLPNYEIALSRVQIYNELSKELRQQRSEKVFEIEGISFTDKEMMLPFSTLELRQLYEDTEVNLREKVTNSNQSEKESSIDGHEDSEENGNKKNMFRSVSFEEDREAATPLLEGRDHLDVFHIWYDLPTATDNNSTFPMASSRRDSGRQPEDPNLRKAQTLLSTNPNPIFKTTEELLHPLERIHEIYHGKLVLVLQSLRFFDVIFWPTEESSIRNNDMLRFSKELMRQPGGTSNNPESTATSTTSNNSNKDSSKKQMSVFSATMRMCIFTLLKLSPTTYLAIHNIKRMRALIKNLDRVSSFNTPTYDWLLAVIGHITIHIQRLVLALEPAFALIGITDRIQIPLVGPWGDSYDSYDQTSQPFASNPQELESIFTSLNQVEILQQLHQYFHSSMGRNLIRNLRASLHLLMDCYLCHSSKLSSSLEERSYNALGMLVEQMRADSQIIQQLPNEVIQATVTPGLKTLKKYNSMYRFEGNYNIESGQGDIYETSNNSNSSNSNTPINSPTSPLTFFQSMRQHRSYSLNNNNNNNNNDPNSNNISSLPSDEYLPPANERSLSFSSNSTTSQRPSFDGKDPTGRQPSSEGNKPPPLSPEKAPTPTPLGTSSSSSNNNTQSGFVEETFNGYDLLMMLKWLRYPYFRQNILRNIQVIKSLQALDYLESRAIYRFSWESQTFKQELEDHRDLAIKSVEEMTELKELSREVGETMVTRQQQRQSQYRVSENMKIRKVAQRWNDCLERAEIDWSPWKQDLTSYYHEFMMIMNSTTADPSLQGIAYYELSKHRDLSFRSLLYTRLSEPIDHKENAYLDSKVRDNEMFYALSNSNHASKSMEAELDVTKEEEGVVVVGLGDRSNSISNKDSSEEGKTGSDPTATNNAELAAIDELRVQATATPIPGARSTSPVPGGGGDPPAISTTTTNTAPSGTLLVGWKDRDNTTSSNNPSLSRFKTGNKNATAGNNPGLLTIPNNDFLFDESNDDLDESRSDSNKSDLTISTATNTTSVDHAVSGFAADFSKTIVTFFQVGLDDRINPQRPLWSHLFSWASDEKTLFMTDVTRIQLDQLIAGTILLTNKCIYFHYKKRLGGLASTPNTSSSSSSSAAAIHALGDRRWYLDRLIEVYGRRYLSQNCAVELFFADSSEVFLAFSHHNELHKFFKLLRNQYTPLLSTSARSLNPRYAYKNSLWTELWRRRQISNFDYLMKLNIMAGRSHNDITQYPVMPWILNNYTSETLDLTDLKNYRDLSKPMGALNEERLKEFKDRYQTFYDDTIPKFMYGSHYSSAGVVLHYMVRQEPYTTLAINLQSGRFDCPDRIFFNIAKTWLGCNHSMSDVKELIPEMFYCPELFINNNRLPLGELQDGNVVDHVVLPPWCQNNPYEFIRIHRQALESDYVSDHLHEWIDLIFGYKQRGEAALLANNVFYYLTYENSIDVSAIEDPLQREATKSQVIHFGQTPSQLLNQPHPKRYAKEDCQLPLCSELNRVPMIQIFTPFFQHVHKSNSTNTTTTGSSSTYHNPPRGAILAIRCFSDRVVFVYQNYTIESYRWSALPDHDGFPFTIKQEKNVRTLPVLSLSMAENVLKGIHIINQNYYSNRQNTGHSIPQNSNSASTSTTSLSSLSSIGSTTVIPTVAPPASTTTATTVTVGEDQNEFQPVVTSEETSIGEVRKSNDLTPEKMNTEVVKDDEKEPEGSSSRPMSIQYEETNDLVSPLDINNNSNTSNHPPLPPSAQSTGSGSGNSVFATIKNSFFGRRKSLSMSLTGSSPSPPSVPTTANSNSTNTTTAATTSLYNAMRLDQKLHPEKRMASSNLPPFYTRPASTSNSIPTTFNRRQSSTTSNQNHSILDICYQGLSPLHAKCITMNDAETYSQGRVISIGYWDNTIKVHTIDTCKEIGSVASGHIGAITCIESGIRNHGSIFVTGGFEGTIRVWVLEKPAYAAAFKPEPFYAEPLPRLEEMAAGSGSGSSSGGVSGSLTGAKLLGSDLETATIGPGTGSSALTSTGTAGLTNSSSTSSSPSASLLSCIHVLCGHNSPISALSYCQDLDVVFSGGSDGFLCLHTIRSGQYIRCMPEMIGSSIDCLLASKNGYLIAHSSVSLQLTIFWLNGQVLHQTTLSDRIECMIASDSGYVLIVGLHSGILSFRQIWDFKELHHINLGIYGAIKSLWLSDDGQYLFVGSEDGTFSIATDPILRLRTGNSMLQKSPYLV